MARLTKLKTIATTGESPRWHDNRLWFSDWGAGQIVALDAKGKTEPILKAPSFPFCFDWLPDGRMLIVSGGDGRLLRREPDGKLVTHADLSALSDFAWKDIVVDGKGNAYVGNIGFDFEEDDGGPGSIALVKPDGKARVVAKNLAFPHGIALTPDGSTLIVAEAYGGRLSAFQVGPSGALTKRRVWADLRYGTPHGICVDEEGAVWYADVPNEQCVRVAEGGETLDIIDVDRGCFACTLGGRDGKTLFLVTGEWSAAMGIDVDEEDHAGRVVKTRAPARRAGRP